MADMYKEIKDILHRLQAKFIYGPKNDNEYYATKEIENPKTKVTEPV